MKIKTSFISILLFLGAIQLNAQRSISDPIDFDVVRPCASLVNVQQVFNQDGTVTITFQVVNNSICESSWGTITSGINIGQSYPINTEGETEISTTITHSGATPGTTIFFTIILYGADGEICCSTGVSIKVANPPGPCDIEAEVANLSCGPNGWARISVTGGTQPYSGPGQEVGTAGNFVIQGLNSGAYTFTFTDSEGCEVEVTFDLPECGCENLEAEVANLSCGPNATAVVNVTGGSQPYSGPGQEMGTAGNFVIQGLNSGTYTFTFTDSEGCEVEVTFTIHEGIEATVTNVGGCAPNATAVVSVTGGTQPYSGPGQEMGTAGNFVIQGLNNGTHTLTFMDSNGCSEQVIVTIEDPLDADISIADSDCTVATGAVVILITGGVPPYTGPNNQQSNIDFYYSGLAVGDYDWSFFDSDGCEVIASFTIGNNGADCSQFTFKRDESGNTGANYQETIISAISATIFVTLEAYFIPDQLIVTVNGDEVVNFSAGSSICDGSSGSIVSDEFCVTYCDVVEFTVLGDICPLGGTLWDLTATCEEKDGGGENLTTPSDILSLRSNSNRESDRYYEEMRLNSLQLVQVFPNPVTDVLNITNLDPIIEYQTARIINSAGNVVHTENMSSIDQLQIDTSAFPKGIYIIEITDNYGCRILEKFTKIE